MKRFAENIKNIFGLTVAASMMLAGCSDDVIPGGNMDDTNNMAVIYVPDVSADIHRTSLTRAEGALTDPQPDEKTITSLYLFAYPVNGKGTATPVKLSDKTPLASVPSDLAGYTGYQLELADGTYKFYVVANVDFPAADVTSETMISEANLQKYTIAVPATAEAGLPMACANSEMSSKKVGETSYTGITSDGVEVKAGNGVKVKADLKFAVAKVRVTLLNDIFPTKTIKSTTISNVPEKTDLFTGSGNTPDLGSSDFGKKGYFKWGTTEMKDNVLDVKVDGLTSAGNTIPADKWIWQGVAYVGERLFAATDSDKPQVSLTFQDNDVTTLPLGSEDKSGLKRSYFYDYVGTPTTEFRLAVQAWTPETIMGSLHGDYYLHVDMTEIPEMKSGEPIAIWYDSNASLKFDFGKYTKNGKEIDVYTKKISNDTIYLSVNSLLTSTDNVPESAYGSFTITAGTIEKKITVDNLNLTEYLNVDKDSDEINVRTVISSGKYSGSTEVTVSTNLSSFTVEKVAETWEDENIATALSLTEGTYNVGESGEVKVPIQFNDLNNNVYWNNMHTVSFKIKGTVNGVLTEKTVNVNIVPATDDYTIYLYAPTWDNPHVYIYQCLKLPSTHSEHPNAPVGDNDKNAALEYSFTGGLAFRGWGVKGKDGSDANNPSESMKEDDYKFYVFNGTGPTSTNSWKPSAANENHYYLIDFYKDYREKVIKTSCKCGSEVDRGFPGIKMTRVESNEHPGNGWWKISLTGIAKPGQALLMFQNTNTSHDVDENKRYPASNKPGIPLFDFPNKIGYFDVTASDKQFVNEKPEIVNNIVRLYVYNTQTTDALNIWPGAGNDVAMNKDASSPFLYYYDVPKNTDVYVKYGSSEKKFNISSDTYANLTDNSTGKLPTTDPASGVRRVFFINDGDWSGVQAYCWQDGNTNNKNAEWASAPAATRVKGRIYFYDVTNSSWNRIIFKNGDSSQTGDCNISTDRLYNKGSKDY